MLGIKILPTTNKYETCEPYFQHSDLYLIKFYSIKLTKESYVLFCTNKN